MSGWTCGKCGAVNTGTVGGVSFGGSFGDTIREAQSAAQKAQTTCASCGTARNSFVSVVGRPFWMVRNRLSSR